MRRQASSKSSRSQQSGGRGRPWCSPCGARSTQSTERSQGLGRRARRRRAAAGRCGGSLCAPRCTRSRSSTAHAQRRWATPSRTTSSVTSEGRVPPRVGRWTRLRGPSAPSPQRDWRSSWLGHAIGICATQCAGLERVQGTDAGALQLGKAAANAVEAALLARCGMTAGLDSLSGRRGLFALLTGTAGRRRTRVLTDGWG
jgi:MmgE/PrpD N-terminal domain